MVCRGIVVISSIALGLGVLWRLLPTNRLSIELSHAVFAGTHSTYVDVAAAELLHSDEEQTLHLLALAYCAQADFSAAREVLERYRNVASPQSLEQERLWVINWSLGLANQGRRAEAEQAMRLLFVVGDDAQGYAGLGQLYQVLQDEERAAQYLLQSLAIRPTARGFMQLGSIYQTQGARMIQSDYHEGVRLLTLASQAFESALQLDARSRVAASYNLGDVYWRLNRPQDAILAYQQAAEEGGQSHFAFLSWFYLGQIYSAWWKGHWDYALARTYYERARSIAANDLERAMSVSGVAAAHAAEGQTRLALIEYRRALEYAPDYAPALQALNQLENK